jgi:hypothetical protein
MPTDRRGGAFPRSIKRPSIDSSASAVAARIRARAAGAATGLFLPFGGPIRGTALQSRRGE